MGWREERSYDMRSEVLGMKEERGGVCTYNEWVGGKVVWKYILGARQQG